MFGHLEKFLFKNYYFEKMTILRSPSIIKYSNYHNFCNVILFHTDKYIGNI